MFYEIQWLINDSILPVFKWFEYITMCKNKTLVNMSHFYLLHCFGLIEKDQLPSNVGQHECQYIKFCLLQHR